MNFLNVHWTVASISDPLQAENELYAEDQSRADNPLPEVSAVQNVQYEERNVEFVGPVKYLASTEHDLSSR